MSVTVAAVVLMMGSPVPEAANATLGVNPTQASVESATAPQVPADPQAGAPATPAPTPIVLPTFGSTQSAEPPVTFDPAASLPTLAPAQPADADADADAANDNADSTLPGSEIVVRHRRPSPGDPLEHINAESFKVVQAVDQAVIEPVAKVYNKGIPRPIRQGLRNFFNNFNEPVVFLAYMLELKPGKAMETAGRFVINTTVGVAGFIDVAKRKPFNLPYRPNGVANVLGYYGVGPGPYMYLPLVGPTTVRDLIGDTLDNLVLAPTLIGKPFNKPEVAIPMSVVRQLGERGAFDEEINRIRKTDDPYATYRELYLRQRQAEIDALHGRVTPNVVPVYGPGMKTPGKKKKHDVEPEAAPETQQPAPASAVPESGADSGSVAVPTATPAPTAPEAAGQGAAPVAIPAATPQATTQPETHP
ncbi:VacJ family lipoprotein [Novosphingobium sp. BL-8H]|uniref:MlaA family lipoprotein n=1 Tax=Novosphingobium sp. BL-8H TaxID=3127640 RepID=UPI0037565F08